MGFQMSKFEFHTCFFHLPLYLGHYPQIFLFFNYDASPSENFIQNVQKRLKNQKRREY